MFRYLHFALIWTKIDRRICKPLLNYSKSFMKPFSHDIYDETETKKCMRHLTVPLWLLPV